MSKSPIFVVLGGNTPKYFELFVRSIKYLKKSIPTAAVGVITPPGTGNLKGAVIDRLAQMDPKLNSNDINFFEGTKHFDDWNNSQYILDIASFAGQYDPVIYLDADTIILRNLTPFIEKFTNSGKKYGFLSDFVNDHANFKKKWEGPLFIPQTTIFFLRSENIAQLTQAWANSWNPWIKPDPFVTIKDPAPGYKYSRVAIQQYSLGQTLYNIVQNFNTEISVIPRSELLLCRNFDVEFQKAKLKFLNAGCSYSNEGKTIITIKVQSGEVYENQDVLGGKGDPYVAVKVGEWERKTEVIKNTKAPVWNEEFVFNLSNYWEANNIVFTLWDWDGLTKNDEVGTAKLSLLGKKVHQQGNSTAYTLSVLDKDGKEQGKLNITAEFYVELLDGEDGVIKSKDLTAGGKKIAVINVIRAKIFERHDVVGEDDPYLKLTLGGITKQTKVIQETQEPVWNEEFTFEDITDTNVVLSLYDRDKLTKDDLIGSGTLSLAPFANKKSHVSVPVYNEKGVEEGKIELDVLLVVDTPKAAVETAPPPPPVEAAPAPVEKVKVKEVVEVEVPPVAPPPPPASKLPPPPPSVAKETSAFGSVQAKANPPPPVKTASYAVLVESGKIAKSHDTFGKGDPYVIVKVNGVERRTTAKMNTLSPRYNERLNFDDIPVTTAQIEISMYDKNDLRADTFIGGAIYTLGGLKNNKAHEKDYPLVDLKSKVSAKLSFQVEIKP